MEIMLRDIRPGFRVVVTEISDDHAMKGRLREFGMIPGTELRCRFLSPGGDLAALELRGTVIALRCGDLKGIMARRCL
jgi:Fe2+ transport system protein FeoA